MEEMNEGQKKLKVVRQEIEAIIRKHDVAGFVTLHGVDAGEVFWNIWPSYSILSGDFPSIRIVSKAADYKGLEVKKREFDMAQTAQMIDHLGTTMGGCGLQFLELAKVLNAKLGATHEDKGFTPDPSKFNPGTH